MAQRDERPQNGRMLSLRVVSRSDSALREAVPAAGPSLDPGKLCNLPPFPAVANEVLSLVGNPGCDLRRVAAAFQRDPAFAAEVLVFANSPMIGLRSRVHSIVQALAVLGLDRIRSLAVTVALRSVMGTPGPSLRQTWGHAAACAIVCQELARAFGVASDHAYTAGLLHDVGRLGLLKSYPSEIEPIFRCAYRDPAEVMAVERTLVRMDHASAGAWLVKTWGFPEDFHDVCLLHHEPASAGDEGLVALVKAGCEMTGALGYASLRYEAVRGYPEIAAEILKPILSEGEMRDRLKNGLQAFLT